MEPLNVLMIGTGEYTTGFVGGGASGSDKKVGVVGLSLFDLRRREKVAKLGMVGVNGKKFPAIREHLHKNISQAYNNLDTSFDSFPANDQVDPDAYKAAIDALSPGDAITVFTPDPTHYPIAKYAIERGIHVLLTKPAVKELGQHQELVELAAAKGVQGADAGRLQLLLQLHVAAQIAAGNVQGVGGPRVGHLVLPQQPPRRHLRLHGFAARVRTRCQ
ncbi:hypothetical protein G7046_g9871 [Stylonectria norvegica]|nr:hypothetical protein G7046_g9871 [Stylonectria norvegica]